MSQYVSLPAVRLLAKRVIDGGSVCKVCVIQICARMLFWPDSSSLTPKPVDVCFCVTAGGEAGAGVELRVWTRAQDKPEEKNGWIVHLKTTTTNNQEVHLVNLSCSAETKTNV